MTPQELHDVEEALGIIWNLTQKAGGGVPALQTVETRLNEGVSSSIFGRLREQGLVVVRDGGVALATEGERIGRDVTRRHRLTERLLADVLDVKGPDIDATACKIEHIISSGIADSICTLLGHPRVCPHGSPIPRGTCCERLQASTEPIVSSLNTLPVGADATVAYLATGSHPFIHKLLSLGLVPGTGVRLHQRSPSFVVQAGETQIALEEEVARHIYVRAR